MVLQTKFFKPVRIIGEEEVGRKVNEDKINLKDFVENDSLVDGFKLSDFIFLEIEKPLVMTQRWVERSLISAPTESSHSWTESERIKERETTILGICFYFNRSGCWGEEKKREFDNFFRPNFRLLRFTYEDTFDCQFFSDVFLVKGKKEASFVDVWRRINSLRMPCLPAGRNKLQKLTFRLNKNPSFKGDSEPSPFTDYNSATKKMTLEGKILEREDKDYFFSSVPDINTVILVTNNEKDIKLKLSEKIEEIFNSERKVVVIDGIKKEDISFSGQDHSYHILTLNMGGENSSAFLEEIKSEESKPETLPETLGDLGEDLPESPLILPILLIAVVFIPLFVVFSKNKKNVGRK